MAIKRRQWLLGAIETLYGGRTHPYIKLFAKDVGVSYGAVYKWTIYNREPRRAMREKIERKTKGYIRAEYWTL